MPKVNTNMLKTRMKTLLNNCKILMIVCFYFTRLHVMIRLRFIFIYIMLKMALLYQRSSVAFVKQRLEFPTESVISRSKSCCLCNNTSLEKARFAYDKCLLYLFPSLTSKVLLDINFLL